MSSRRQLRIIHINNVANTAATLVEGLQAIGHLAELRPMRLAAARLSTAVKLLALPDRLQEMASVNRQVRKGNYDVVHIHFAYLGWLGILGRYPYVLHCHGSDLRRDLQDPVRRWSIAQSLRRAKVVLASTPDLLKILAPYRPDAVFLPNPVNLQRFTNHTQARPEKPRKILIISYLSPVKGVEVAFEAAKKLISTCPDMAVTAINAGPQRKIYEEHSWVNFIPPVPYSEMPDLILDHDIVLGQFKLGVLGMAELESLACGKPVVCYSTYDDFYSEPPPVLSTNQPDEVTRFVRRLIDEPDLYQEYSQKGRKWVVEQHDYIHIARKAEELYYGMFLREKEKGR